LALIWPEITLFVLVALFAAFALISGAASIVVAIRHRGSDSGWWLMLLLLGLVSVAAGIIAIVDPRITIFVLVLLMGANALFTGVLDIILAIRLRKQIEGEWLLALSGVISIVFGVVVIVFPPAGALAIAFLVGLYATVIGILLLVLAFRVRQWAKHLRWVERWFEAIPAAGHDLGSTP
jgi:uncharacterized membrane protein HdeD (DUF308 family)